MKPHILPIPPSDLMDFNQLCDYVGKSRPWVYDAMVNKGLPAHRLGRWAFLKSEIDDWIKSIPGINLPN